MANVLYYGQSYSHSPTPTHIHSHVFYYLVTGGASPPYKYIVKCMAVAVAVAADVCGGRALVVALAMVASQNKIIIISRKNILISVWG